VVRFLGHKVPADGNPRAEVVSDMKRRPEGVRIKHRVGQNSIKMYDKQGSVLRVETTIDDAAVMAAGPDGSRDPAPNKPAASRAMDPTSFSGSSVRPIVISFNTFTRQRPVARAAVGVCRSPGCFRDRFGVVPRA